MVLLSSSGHGIIGSGIALAIVASVAVVLRLVAKRVAKRATQGGIATDDYWIIFAATTFWVYVGVELWGIYVGAGGANLDNLRTMDPPALAIFFKVWSFESYSDWALSGLTLATQSIQVNISFLAVTMTGVKLSLLSLYDRLFPLRWFRRAIVVLSGICVVWLLALVLCSVFVCFDQSDDHCVDFSTFYLVLSLVGVLMEITILGLPIRIIIGLQMPARDRILLVFTFLLGGL
ncbi:hypothetical protein MMC07_005190 [Pseudocyphellaria aurata]|nr:hypothetical protein [Pseudocyphellaria aurata]